jgi:hypothetical protein
MADTMEIYVKITIASIRLKVIALKVKSSDTSANVMQASLRALKQKMQSKNNQPKTKQRILETLEKIQPKYLQLVFADKHLENNGCTLADYGVREGSDLYLVTKKVLVTLFRSDIHWQGKFVLTEPFFEDLQTFDPSFDFNLVTPYLCGSRGFRPYESWSRMWCGVETVKLPSFRNEDELILMYLVRNKQDGTILANCWPKDLTQSNNLTCSFSQSLII